MVGLKKKKKWVPAICSGAPTYVKAWQSESELDGPCGGHFIRFYLAFLFIINSYIKSESHNKTTLIFNQGTELFHHKCITTYCRFLQLVSFCFFFYIQSPCRTIKRRAEKKGEGTERNRSEGEKKESQCDIRATRREPDQWRGTADFFLFFFFFWARWQKKGEEKEREQTNETRAGPSDTNRWREVSAVVLIEGKLRDFVPTCFSAVAHLLPLTHTHTHTQASPQAISCPLHQCPLTGWNVRVTHAEKPLLAKFMCLWVVGHTHRLLYFHVDNKMPVKHIPR